MRVVAFDTETHLIVPGDLSPPLVCLTVAWTGTPPEWLPLHDPAAGVVRDDDAALLTSGAVTPEVVRALLSEGVVVGANAAYDLLVLVAHGTDLGADLLPDVTAALREGRVADVQIRERLIELAHGRLARKHDLARLVRTHLGPARGDALVALKGPDAWRMRYAELEDVPLGEWPDAARAYAIDDARLTLAVYWAQARTEPYVDGYPLVPPGGRIVSEDREARAAWALHRVSAWGVRTDSAAVEPLLDEWSRTAEEGTRAGVAGGWVRAPTDPPRPVARAVLEDWVTRAHRGDPPRTRTGRVTTAREALSDAADLDDAPDELVEYVAALRAAAGEPGTVDQRALRRVVTDAYGGHPPRTDPSDTFPSGQVSTSTEVLLHAATLPGAPGELVAYADSLQAGRYLALWATPLRAGAVAPICARYTHLVRTGRTACSGPPWQQTPQSGGVRECVVPRPGYVLCSVDYDVAELCALAQVQIWMGIGDTLARAINGGLDIHCLTAEAISRAEGHPRSYADIRAGYKANEPGAIRLRSLAKVANFGFPGGLGATTFVAYAAGQGVIVSQAEAELLRAAWLEAWPEMREYFARINRLLGERGSMTAQHPLSGRLRGDTGYTDGCNGFFQGLVADGAKHALWDLTCAAYGDPSSLAYGVRPIVFVHDEVIAEVPLDRAHEAAEEMARIMREALQAHTPDVRIGAEPALMTRWHKRAKTVRDTSGRLVPWAPG